MASIASALAAVKSEFHKHVPESLLLDLCRQVDHRWRRRLLDPATTLSMLLLQALHGVSMLGVRHVSRLKVSAAALCKARRRLPQKLFVEWIARLIHNVDEPLWLGRHRVMMTDGTSVSAQDTPELAGKFGKAPNPRDKSSVNQGYPIPKLLMLIDWATGLIHRVITLPQSRQEYTVFRRLLGTLRAGDVLLGDRGLASYANLHALTRIGAHACMRLSRSLKISGRGNPRHRFERKLGRQDWIVRWLKPKHSKAPTMSRRRRLQLPESLTLRQIAFRILRKGFRPTWAWVITTLMDPVQYPAQDIIDLYQRRWQIEVDFRDLKKTLGMEKLAARSLDGMRKELLTFVLAYNLVRRVMLQAAANQNVAADRISFQDALTWLKHADPGDPVPKLHVNPQRRRPSEPRARKHGGFLFPVMKHPRDELRKPPAMAVL